ncbi:Zinc finger, RING-type [Corchorus olitorius]|uniref:Zinc finger, RING-type n=1 Tax=Corchorus olitorius TaxID=93759 RepID=A0A1R3JWF0_9ROSI|nr:Zinc finger, RING-type [Corchorus olitorius]
MNQEGGANQSGSCSGEKESNPCPICLGPMVQESYLDTCFHKFCYNCIVRWSKVVSGKRSRPSSSLACPLCKKENFSVISGFDGTCFQRHYVDHNFEDRFTFSKAHKYRLQCYYSEPGILNDIFDVLRFWKSRKYLQSNMWLQSWLKRELQALMQEEDVDIVVYHIHGVIESFLRRIEQTRLKKSAEAIQEDFKITVSDAAKPFLLARTDRFVTELELFLASGLNIEAYDAVYMQRLGWNTPGGTNGTRPAEEPIQHVEVVPYWYIVDADSDEDG